MFLQFLFLALAEPPTATPSRRRFLLFILTSPPAPVYPYPFVFRTRHISSDAPRRSTASLPLPRFARGFDRRE